MSHHASGSSLDLVLAGCLHSFTAGATYPDPPPEVFAFGNATHDVSERLISWERVDLEAIATARALAPADARRLRNVAGHVLDWFHDRVRDGWMLWAEVPVAWSHATGRARVLASRGHRDYLDASADEFVSTVDVVGVRRGDLAVWDWKSGRRRRYDGVSWQLRLGALGLARLFGASSAHVGMLYVSEEGTYEDGAELDAIDLAETASALTSLAARLRRGPQPPVAGSYCVEHHCRGVGHCAATRAALAEMAGSAVVKVATPEDAARVWAILPAAEAALKAAKEQVRQMALRAPIPLPDGRRLVVTTVERESISLSGETRELVPPEAIEATTSKAAIERVVGRAGAREVLARLREAGAVKTSRYDNLKAIETDDAADAAE